MTIQEEIKKIENQRRKMKEQELKCDICGKVLSKKYIEWETEHQDELCYCELFNEITQEAKQDEIKFLKKIQFTEEADYGDIDEVREMIDKRLKKLKEEVLGEKK